MLRAKEILPRAISSSELMYVVTLNQAVVTLFVKSVSGPQKNGACAPEFVMLEAVFQATRCRALCRTVWKQPAERLFTRDGLCFVKSDSSRSFRGL